jgi:hypothetical protein
MESEELNDAVVEFELKFVNGIFFIKHTLGELLIGFEHSVDGLMDGALAEAAHPEQALLQFVEIFFEVAFHEVGSLTQSERGGYLNSFLGLRINQNGR